jgi:type IV pilus assembly protein PilM
VTATGAALKVLARRESLHGACIVGLPGHLTFNKAIRIPRVSARQRRKIIGFEARQGVPAALADVVWSHAPVAKPEDGLEVALTAVKRPVMDALCAQLRAAGLYPCAALPAWFVLQGGVEHNHPDADGALILAIGARSTQLSVCGTSRFFIRTIALGGNTVTQRIARELETDFFRAESLKREVLGGEAESPAGAPERRAVQVAVDEFVRRLCGETLRSLAWFGPESGASRPALLLLSGGGSLIRDLPARLAENLQMRVVRRDPWQHLKLGAAVADLPGKSEVARLADLVGLAARAASREHAGVNLLPPALRREMVLRRRWPELIAATLLLAVGLACPIRHERAAAAGARRQRTEVEATISALRRLDIHNRNNLARLAETNRRIAALQRLAEARRGWIVFLSDLQERLVKTGDVWLEKLQIVPPGPARPAGIRPGLIAAAENTERNEPAAVVRLNLAGCLFDPENPATRTGEGSYQRAKSLLAGFRESPFIVAVEDERFDGSQPGVLRFEITLVLAPRKLF